VTFTLIPHQFIFLLPPVSRLPSAPFSSFFDLPQSSVIFAFPQFAHFASIRSFLDHPSLFATVFYDEEQVANGDQMVDEEQIGLISSDMIITKKS
jgi:hypothetical protein